jgi:GNAT superfamily N-acetyltransferase
MSSEVEIIRLTRLKKDVLRFLRVSYGIYRKDPLWVAPLLADQKQVFSDRNPFFEHAEMELWVARQDGRDVGRIAGIIDRTHNQCHKEQTAFFGYFESINDPQVSRKLFESLFAWCREKQLTRVVGPMNPSANDECGLLVEGFDSSPVFMMTYNPRYYSELVEAEGFKKAKDLLAFFFDVVNSPFDRLERIAAVFRQRQPQFEIRTVTRTTLDQELPKIKEAYNAAWDDNWGFVPMTDAEMNFMAERLKPLMVEGLVWIAESLGEPAAFMLAMPDYNEAIKRLKGRLFTPRLFGALPYLLGWKISPMARVIALGVTKKYRGRGLESAILSESLKYGKRLGFKTCEASWILEDNSGVQRVIELFGGKVYKTYRLYEREL